MWRFADRRRVKKEIQHLLKFLLEYFGAEVQTIIVYGSFLRRWSFRQDSDVDVAIILRDSPEWRWSNSESFWQYRDNSPHRQNFSRKLEKFLEKSGISHPYDVKVFTTRDLTLLEEFHRVYHVSGNLVPSIRAGKIIFRKQKEGNMEMKKGNSSFVEFLDQELPALGMTHWYGSYDSYHIGLTYHDIGKIVTVEHRFLFFKWTSKCRVTIASVIAEPDSPIGGANDALRLRVKNREALPVLKALAEKFEGATFGLKAELIY